jgi:hypothetical protein
MDEYVFNAKDHHHDAYPLHFKLQEDPNHTTSLHCQIRLKLGMFIELCAENYATYDELFNGVGGIFKFATSLPNNESLICIQFSNSKTCTNICKLKINIYI